MIVDAGIENGHGDAAAVELHVVQHDCLRQAAGTSSDVHRRYDGTLEADPAHGRILLQRAELFGGQLHQIGIEILELTLDLATEITNPLTGLPVRSLV